MKWYWWALIALAVIVIIYFGWNVYQKSKATAASTTSGAPSVSTSGMASGTTVSVAPAGTSGQKVVIVKQNP